MGVIVRTIRIPGVAGVAGATTTDGSGSPA